VRYRDRCLQTFTNMTSYNYVIDRNEYLLFTLAEFAVPQSQAQSIQFPRKSTRLGDIEEHAKSLFYLHTVCS